MGWLNRVRNAEDRAVLNSRLDQRFDWASWAAENGWTYQETAPELAGRYRPALDAGAERYGHLMTTNRNGMPVQAFQYAKHVWDNAQPAVRIDGGWVLAVVRNRSSVAVTRRRPIPARR